ncbi:TPA: hypothetical protein ACJGU4_004537, partial [Salmonella enterica subsp. enterica serovar Virchow]
MKRHNIVATSQRKKSRKVLIYKAFLSFLRHHKRHKKKYASQYKKRKKNMPLDLILAKAYSTELILSPSGLRFRL